MGVSFPTGHTHMPYALGSPGHARPCQCDRPLVLLDADECLRCGRYPKPVIQRTWQERAEKIAARGRARKLKALA